MVYGAGPYDNYPLIGPFCIPPWELDDDEDEEEERPDEIEPWELRED